MTARTFDDVISDGTILQEQRPDVALVAEWFGCLVHARTQPFETLNVGWPGPIVYIDDSNPTIANDSLLQIKSCHLVSGIGDSREDAITDMLQCVGSTVVQVISASVGEVLSWVPTHLDGASSDTISVVRSDMVPTWAVSRPVAKVTTMTGSSYMFSRYTSPNPGVDPGRAIGGVLINRRDLLYYSWGPFTITMKNTSYWTASVGCTVAAKDGSATGWPYEPPPPPIKVGDRCPTCGQLVQTRPLFTGTFVGCLC